MSRQSLLVPASTAVVLVALAAVWLAGGPGASDASPSDRRAAHDPAPQLAQDSAAPLERVAASAPSDTSTRQGTSPAPESERMRWARSDIGARSRSNITARQRTVRAFLPYLEGDREYAEERQYSDGAYIAAQTAIMVIYDAEGKSFGLPEGLELPGDTSPKEFLREQGIEYHHTDSGGSSYIIPHGEFPAYDELVELRKDGRPVPVDDVPLERIASLCRRALAYRLP